MEEGEGWHIGAMDRISARRGKVYKGYFSKEGTLVDGMV